MLRSATQHRPCLVSSLHARRKPFAHAKAGPTRRLRSAPKARSAVQGTSSTSRGPLQRVKEIVTSSTGKVMAALAVALVLVMSTPGIAEAARSGGRMGGAGFSSRGSMGGSSSLGGMGGSMGSRSRSAPMPYSGGRTHTMIAPAPSFGYYPAPMGYGVGVGGGGSALFSFLIIGVFAYVLFNTFSGSQDEYDEYEEAGREPMSVVKVQVGLLGTARDLQQDLNRMANKLDTSTSQGLHYLLQETVLALQRNPQYAIYGKSELTKTRGLDNAENKFNQASMQERGKFERETLSNYGGNRNQNVHRVSGDGENELIVVTIVAAVEGKLTPSPIQDTQGLKENLSLLGSVPADSLLALEVLWTPQDENDYFTKDELVTDYPDLNML